MTGGWDLVGRGPIVSSSLASLRDHRGTVLVADAGVGKTRLAREIGDRAERVGWTVLRFTASRSAQSIPLGALAPHLPIPGERAADLADTLRQTGDSLRATAGGRLLISVDDAHLLDDATATVVHQLALADDATVLATVRQGDACPDPVLALWKDGHARRVDLGPLDRDMTLTLLEAALGGPVDGMTARVVWESSLGNPLYLRELVEGALEAGLLTEESGLWRLGRSPVVNRRLVDLVEARLDRLETSDRDLLTVLAVGEELPITVLEDMGFGDRLETLEQLGLLETHQDRRRCSGRLAHPLHRQVLDHQTSDRRRQAIARDLADRIAATGARRREDVLRLGLWRLEGGGDTDAGLMTEAARRVSVLHDDELGVRLSQAALDVGGGFSASLINGAGRARLGQVGDAEAVLASVDLESVRDADKVILTIARADNLFWAMGEPAAAIAAVTEVRALVGDPEADAELGVNAAVYSFMTGRPGEAIAALESVIDEAPDRVAVTAAMSLAPSLAVSGRGDDGVRVVERALAIRSGLDAPERLTEEPMLHMSLGFALIAAGRLPEAESVARAGYDLSVVGHDHHGEAWCAMILAVATRLCGQVSVSARWGGEGAAKFDEVGMAALARVCSAARMQSLALLGQPEEAGELRQVVEATAPGLPTLEVDVIRALAWERAMAGDEIAAVQHLRDAAAQAESMGARFLEVGALHDRVRLGQADEVVDRLVAVAIGQQSDVVTAMGDHARASAAQDGPGLEAASEAFEDLQLVLVAAEAAAQAAAAFRSSGDSRSARHSAGRATALGSQADGVQTPALALAGAAGRLTRREREVATASAAGLTNREVAEKLGVSVRTIETHLHRTYEKLGTDRSGLRSALDEVADDRPAP